MSDESIERSLTELTGEAGEAPGKTRHIEVGHDLPDACASWLDQMHAGKAVVIVCDPHTKLAAAESLAARVQLGRRRTNLVVMPVPHGEEHVVCDDASIEALADHLGTVGDAAVIAVGSGTINDIVKMATFKRGLGYVAYATASSMNGYTSAIAAVLSRGVKRTLPAQQPEAVFADLGVISRAPAYLNQAGFGDLLSKPYSNADWLLSHHVRGVPFEARPAQLLDAAYEALLEKAADIGHGELDGIGTLTRTILLSGFTMAIAGTSAPASGGEHLISHYWDMERHCQDRPLFGLHGTQVGIATRISALLFERLVELEPGDFDIDAAVALRDQANREDFAARHPRLTAGVVREVREQFESKQKSGEALRDELAGVQARWGEIREALVGLLVPSRRITEALAAAGAPSRPTAIGIDTERALHTVSVCREMRGRYVALDLMADLGYLERWAGQAIDIVEA